MHDSLPFSAIGYVEFRALHEKLSDGGHAALDKTPPKLSWFPNLYYGSGFHVSDRRSILSRVSLHVIFDRGSELLIRHLVIKELYQ